MASLADVMRAAIFDAPQPAPIDDNGTAQAVKQAAEERAPDGVNMVPAAAVASPSVASGSGDAAPAALPLVEVYGISCAARALQADMAASGQKISAADAVNHVIAQQGAAKRPIAGKGTPSASEVGAFYAEVTASWNRNPNLKRSYANYIAYQTSREVDYCRANSIGLEQLRGQSSPADDFLLSLENHGGPVSEGAKAKVHAAQKAWNSSPDLRREFVSFASYASFVLTRNG